MPDRSLIATLVAVACGLALLFAALADPGWSRDVLLGLTGVGIIASALR